MGHRNVVVISGYETVKEALVNQADAFAERPNIPIFEDLTKGNGNLVLFFLINLTYSIFFPYRQSRSWDNTLDQRSQKAFEIGSISLTSAYSFNFETTDSGNKTIITLKITTATNNQ